MNGPIDTTFITIHSFSFMIISRVCKCFSPEVPKKDDLQPAQVDNVEPAPKSLDATTTKTIFEPGTLMPYINRDDNFPFLNGFPFLYLPFGSMLRFAQIR